MKISEIRRNDIPAALRFVRELGREPRPDEIESLLMLQSDPEELIRLLDAILAER